MRRGARLAASTTSWPRLLQHGADQQRSDGIVLDDQRAQRASGRGRSRRDPRAGIGRDRSRSHGKARPASVRDHPQSAKRVADGPHEIGVEARASRSASAAGLRFAAGSIRTAIGSLAAGGVAQPLRRCRVGIGEKLNVDEHGCRRIGPPRRRHPAGRRRRHSASRSDGSPRRLPPRSTVSPERCRAPALGAQRDHDPAARQSMRRRRRHRAHRLASSSSNAKIEPSPGRGDNVRLAPMRSTIRLEMARPSPAPAPSPVPRSKFVEDARY